MTLKKGALLTLLFTVLFSLSHLAVRAQEARVTATLDPPKILIGEETTLVVRVSHIIGKHVELTLPKDTLVTGVEIKREVLRDSAAVTDTLREYIYHVTLTSFDSASYRLRHIAAMVGGNVVSADEAPVLMVSTVPVDADHPEKFADIKGQWRPGFVWRDYLWVFVAIVAFVLLSIGSYLLWKKYASRPYRREEMPLEPVIERDPYEEALEGMQALRSSDLLETKRIKEYYTGITEILRRYLHRVYGMDTAEKTSREILEAFRNIGAREKELTKELRRILETADFAKFAKYLPTEDENKALWEASGTFIDEVHRENTKPFKPAENEETGGSESK